ncbi:MAG: hypothetical protein IJL33_08285 [Ruminococcus sp.]|nr:hypothetical protein [Ruminococcus sp.]
MKKTIIILLISTLLTSCGNYEGTAPTVNEETKTVSHIADEAAITTASITTVTQTSAVSVTSEVTTQICSQTVTSIYAEEAPTAVTDVQPKTQVNITQEATVIESTDTSVQTEPPVVTKAPVATANTTATKAVNTITTTKSVTTAPPITTAEIYTEPAKMNITEHWLIYFDDSHDKDYYVDIGRSLSNDGSDSSKVQAVFDYVTANFSNDDSCTYLSAVTMCLCEGIGLDCKYALISDWYAHCANAVNVDGVWYVLDTQAGGFLCGNFGFTSILDEYENELSLTLSDSDY